MPHADLSRVRRIMAERGLDALICFKAEDIYYLSGFQQLLEGPSITLTLVFPADQTLKPAMLVSDFEEGWARKSGFDGEIRPLKTWVEMEERKDLEEGRTVRRQKPIQLDMEHAIRELRDILSERKLMGARIGCELANTPARLMSIIKQNFPELELKDSADILWEIKSVKTPEEINALREATRLTELGMKAITTETNPRGKSVSQLRLEYEIAIMEAVRHDNGVSGLSGLRIFLNNAGEVGRYIACNETLITDGDILWVDCAVMIEGYSSDIGRAFSVGEPAPLAKKVYEALGAGHRAGLASIKPGVKFSDVFHATHEAVRSAGLPTYTRGHQGHCIGIGDGEQPPFISPIEHRVLEAGMTLAHECPLHVKGLGGFQIEDNLLVTSTGIENFTTLPYTLVEV